VLIGWTGVALVEQQIMMNEEAATLPLPMWVVGIIMPLSSAIAILAIVESVRSRRELIAVPEPGLMQDEFARELLHADISVSGGHSS